VSGYPETSELDKMKSNRGEAHIIGEFLEWLSSHSKFALAEWITYDSRQGEYCDVGEHRFEDVLREYYAIDSDKVEEERGAVYAYLQEQNSEERIE
jgi:hypothetical protein